MSVYQIVTKQIISELEKGVIPWHRPWKGHLAVNWVTQKPYRGINQFLLPPGEYATFNTIKKHGGYVKRGEKAHTVVFWKWIEIEEKKDDDEIIIKQVPLLRYYKVFEINTQVVGLKSKISILEDDLQNEERCKEIIDGYKESPEIKFAPGRAFYNRVKDFISVPPVEHFRKKDEFYSTLFHELIHSTGHPKRLNRKGVASQTIFGDEDYSQEELVAELGAAMLCAYAGISSERTLKNSASYIQSWLKRLKNDKRLIVIASQQAQKACDYILNTKREQQEG